MPIFLRLNRKEYLCECMKRILLVFLMLMICCALGAQSNKVIENPRGKSTSLSKNSSMEKMLDSKVNINETIPHNYRGYTDEKLEEFNKQMREKEWNSEDGAWKRACEIDTKYSYQRYKAMYPSGAHIAEANKRYVDANIAETLSKAHNSLPNIKHTETDDDSMTSIIVIDNNTDYPLTVFCSGLDVESVLIPVGGRKSLTLENGEYKLAASVPPAHIKPYAGVTQFVGGRYEMGFWVVSR